ncbi:zinc metalloprotease HtpX [Candidatus Woesearchaeota archaeon]|nr:zinc metalloprotease HtpX [Candidatus Woesearchaeota archaeon]
MFSNQLKTIILLGILSALLLWIGSFFGQEGLLIGLAFALIMNVGSYFFSHKLVLAMYRAKEANEKDYPEIFKSVREVSNYARITMPKIYILPTSSPNAFATGRNPKNAVVALSEGIISLLKKDELKGVIAHEVAHIKNRDILIATIAATIASVISYLAMMARWAAIFGGFGGRDSRDGGRGLELLFLAILTPLIATIIQLAISRSREYIADETGAKLTRQPYSLASALEKISNETSHHPMRHGSNTTASLFICNPFNAKNFLSWFSTHPPIEDRIKRLRSMRV